MASTEQHQQSGQDSSVTTEPSGGLITELASISRLHIIGVAMAATLVFGWLLHGSWVLGIAVIGGVDWTLINLLNRITDLEEDLANEIRGTKRVAGSRKGFIVAWLVIFVASFGVSIAIWPELTWLRLLVQVIGVGYSTSIVPTFKGLKRFKDIYFLKNFMSAMLFVLTCFIYSLAVHGWTVSHPSGYAALVALILFFVPFELTYEVIYDMRDLEGDRKAGVPTYPVVHGLERSRQIVDGLLVLASVVMVVALFSGVLGLREGLMLAAPAVQFSVYRPRYERGLTSADCIGITHLGTFLLLFYIGGTQVWSALGMPANIWLR